MTRKKLSSLNSDVIAVTGSYENGRRTIYFHLKRGPGRKFLIQAGPDDLFDKDGNRFEDDLS